MNWRDCMSKLWLYVCMAGWLPACSFAAGVCEDDEQQQRQQQLKEFIEYKISTKMRWNYGHTLCIRVNRTPKKAIHLIWAWALLFVRSLSYSCNSYWIFVFLYFAHFNLKRLYVCRLIHTHTHTYLSIHYTYTHTFTQTRMVNGERELWHTCQIFDTIRMISTVRAKTYRMLSI